MSRVFARSLQAIEDDGCGSTGAWICVVLVFLALWTLWFVTVDMRVVETTARARLETGAATRPIQSTVTARLLQSHLSLGVEVSEGEVLIELDATRPRLELDDLRQRGDSCAQQLLAVRSELQLRERGLLGASELARAESLEARARQKEAQLRTSFADSEAERIRGLASGGSLPRLELQRALTEQQTRQALTDALVQDVARTKWESRRKQMEEQAGLARLRREIASLTGEASSLATAIRKQEASLASYTIRSPAAGRVGEVVGLGAGAVVQAGEKLGSIVPNGEVLAVADFSAAAAVGRVREYQPAEVRLNGFPWTEYGSLHATVKSVGSEPREGRVRVQLVIDPTSNFRIPLQHGLTGTVEIEVERTSPARLALRALGATRNSRSEAGTKP